MNNIVEDFKTTKLKEAVIFDNFIYNLKKSNPTCPTSLWTCRKCKTSITTDGAQRAILKFNGKCINAQDADLYLTIRESHSHDRLTDSEVQRARFLFETKTAVNNTESSTVKNVYNASRNSRIQTSGIDGASALPNFVEIQSSLYRQRSKHIPPIPKKVTDIIIEDD
jgi:hypothetical protein